jgi:hypothetical protein
MFVLVFVSSNAGLVLYERYPDTRIRSVCFVVFAEELDEMFLFVYSWLVRRI